MFQYQPYVCGSCKDSTEGYCSDCPICHECELELSTQESSDSLVAFYLQDQDVWPEFRWCSATCMLETLDNVHNTQQLEVVCHWYLARYLTIPEVYRRPDALHKLRAMSVASTNYAVEAFTESEVSLALVH